MTGREKAEQGKVLDMDGTLEDTSQRKRAAETQAVLSGISNAVQAAREESELFAALRRELHRVIDTTNFFIALCDRHGEALTLPYFVDEQDQLAPSASGKTLTSLVIRTKRPLLVTGRDIERLIAAGEVELVGSMCKVWLGVPLEAAGQVIGVLAVQSYTDEAAFGPEDQEILEFISSQIGTGITRVRAQQELRRLKEFNEGILQSMAEGIVVQDREGTVAFVNPAAAAMLGYDDGELVGRPWSQIVPGPERLPRAMAHERRQRGVSDRYEMDLVRKDGSRFPVLVSSSPLYDTDTGSSLGTIAVFADISERATAVEVLARHAREMAALYETSLEMNSQRDLAALLQAIVARASSLVNANIGALYLQRPDGQSLEVVVGHNLDPAYIGLILPLGEGLSGRVALAGKPTMVDDYREWPGRARVYEGSPFLRVLAVPLRIGEQVIGVINVIDSLHTGGFTEDQVRLVGLFADQASLAVQKARLFEAEERRRREAETLYSATQALSASLDLQQVLRLILTELRQVVPYDSASVQRIRSDGRCEIIGGHGFPNLQALLGTSFDLDAGDNPNGQVVWQRAALILHDAPAIYHGFSRGPHTQAAVRSWLGVPLLFGDQVIGMIALDKKEPGFYTGEHARLAQAFAAQAAAAMENARLFEAEREQRELAEALRQATAAVSSTLDLDQMLDCILEQVDRVIPNDAVNITLLFHGDECRLVRSRGYERLGSKLEGLALSLASTPTFRAMVATGEALVFPDTKREPRWSSIPGIEWVRSYAGAPIKARNQVIGFLNVDSGTPGFYTQAHAHRLQAFADQVSLALANAQSFASVEQARRDWEATFNAMQDPIVLVDAQRRIRRANQAFADLVGSSADQLTGRVYDHLFMGQACRARPCPLERAHACGEPTTCVHNYRERVFDVQATPMQAGNHDSGSAVSVIYAMRDVTREMQLEQQFRQAQKLDSLGRLAGGIAHDFNNLLTVIHLSGRMLEQRLRPEDPLWEHVQNIRQTVDRAAKLTKQLLSFSRREVIDPQVLSLNQSVGDLSRMLQRIIGEDIELRLDLAPDLWPVKADPAQVEQVMMNLVVNARDAMPTGGTLTIGTANVCLDERYVAMHVDAAPGEHVLLTIGDTGEGMDDEVKSHLFEPFFTTKSRGQGTGLGLSTVFGIVKQNQGHIEVESQPGKGTRLLIYLPRTVESRATGRWGAEPVAPEVPSPSRATILVVEDDRAVRSLTTRVLTAYGYRVLEADDGARGQQLAEAYEGSIDLLITDMVMPRQSGRELAGELQRSRPGTPVLYISGYAGGSFPPLPAPTAFLPKPFSVEDLLRLVQSMLCESG